MLNHEIVPRIWDCFLLDGEVYGFKTSLGILKYYEVELRLSTFDEAIIILKRLPAETIEEKLFALIEEINVRVEMKVILKVKYYRFLIMSMRNIWKTRKWHSLMLKFTKRYFSIN